MLPAVPPPPCARQLRGESPPERPKAAMEYQSRGHMQPHSSQAPAPVLAARGLRQAHQAAMHQHLGERVQATSRRQL